jgi:hypothetical protein
MRVMATEEVKLLIERAFAMGVQGLVTTSGAYVRGTGGLTDQTSGGMGITNSSQFVGGSDGTGFCDETYFTETYLKNLFAKGSNRKTLYCSANALIGIGKFSFVKQQTRVAETEYGYNITNFITPFGEASLVWYPLLEGTRSNWVIGVDKEDYMKYRFLNANGVNRDLQYQKNIHTPDSDERKDQYLAEIGLQLAGGGQGVHRLLTNGAAA